MKSSTKKMEKCGRGRHQRRGRKMVRSDDELPEFFNVYLDEIFSEKMRIPPAFIKNFGGNVPEVVTLKTISGISFEADVNKIDDCWFLEDGWPKFVNENSLDEGDLMTFSYAGNAVFHVKIFAINGCIKAICDLAVAADDEASEPENSEDNRSNGRNVSARMPSGRESNGGSRSFSVVMKNSWISKGWMHVPTEFSRAHLGMVEIGESRMVTLWMKKKSWNVRLAASGDRVHFSKGWRKFAKDNSLGNFNLCTFRLIDSSDWAFSVTVDR